MTPSAVPGRMGSGQGGGTKSGADRPAWAGCHGNLDLSGACQHLSWSGRRRSGGRRPPGGRGGHPPRRRCEPCAGAGNSERPWVLVVPRSSRVREMRKRGDITEKAPTANRAFSVRLEERSRVTPEFPSDPVPIPPSLLATVPAVPAVGVQPPLPRAGLARTSILTWGFFEIVVRSFAGGAMGDEGVISRAPGCAERAPGRLYEEWRGGINFLCPRGSSGMPTHFRLISRHIQEHCGEG